jgi:hypothetical protein
MKPATFAIALLPRRPGQPPKREPVQGYVRKFWGIHRKAVFDRDTGRELRDSSYWVVTHLATGRQAATRNTKADAADVARKLDKLVPSASEDPDEIVSLASSIPNLVAWLNSRVTFNEVQP